MVYKRGRGKPRDQPPEKLNFDLKPVEPSMHKDVFTYLNSVFKISEQDFYEVFLKVSSHLTAAIKDGVLVGFGALQEMADHVKITPLYAESKEIVEVLLKHLASQIPDDKTAVVPLPDVNRASVNQMMERSGYQIESEAFIDKIYTKRKVELNFEKVFSFWYFEAVYQ